MVIIKPFFTKFQLTRLFFKCLILKIFLIPIVIILIGRQRKLKSKKKFIETDFNKLF